MSELFVMAMEDREKRLIEYEKDTIDFNHHEAGGWLAQKWKLPYEIIDIIEHHHDRDFKDKNTDLVLLIGLCSRIARQWLLQTNYNPLEESELFNKLNIKTESLKTYLDKCHKKLDDINQLVDEIAG